MADGARAQLVAVVHQAHLLLDTIVAGNALGGPIGDHAPHDVVEHYPEPALRRLPQSLRRRAVVLEKDSGESERDDEVAVPIGRDELYPGGLVRLFVREGARVVDRLHSIRERSRLVSLRTGRIS